MKQWKGKDRVNAGKTKIMICGSGLDLLQSSGEFPCAFCCTGVGSNSIFCNGCKHWVHKKCSGLKRLTKDPDYRCTWCQGTARPLDGSPSRTWQAGGGSFLLLPRRHALSSRWPWPFNQHTCENRLEEIQGSAISSPRHLSFKTHVSVCTALVCGVQCSMPVRLGHWQNQTLSMCSRMTGQWSDRSAMSGCKTLSQPGPLSYLHGLALRIWTSFWRREGSAGMDMWNALMMSQDSLSRTGWGKAGPGRP